MAFRKKEKNQNVGMGGRTVALKDNPLYQAPRENEKKEIITAIVTVAVCIVIFALIVSNFSMYSSEPSYSTYGTGGYSDPDPGDPTGPAIGTAEPEDEEEEEPEEEIDMSMVDINASLDSYVELAGTVDEYGECLQMEEILNIYAWDEIQGEDVLVENVDKVYIDDTSLYSMEEYAGRNVMVGGDLWFESGTAYYRVTTIISAEPEIDDPGIHRYQIVVADCSWEEALYRSQEQGGYLARISSAEEYQYITNMLNDYTNIHFYLGGRRDDTGSDYYWVNKENEFMGECLNSSDSFCMPYWYSGEPSYNDTGSEATGMITEDVMNLFYVSGTWYLNDSSGNLAQDYPELLSGKVGYIIEFEE